MISKQNPGAAPAAPKPNGLLITTPKVVAMEVYDREEQVLRFEVVRAAA